LYLLYVQTAMSRRAAAEPFGGPQAVLPYP
jgi:hypothetical protein